MNWLQFNFSYRYGDVTPRTVLGRVLGVIWMMFGLVLGSVITASVAESMTGTIDFEIKEGQKVSFSHCKN